MINPLSNPQYLIPPLVGAATSFSLIVLVLRKNHRNSAHRIFSLVLLSSALWSIFIFAMRATPDTQHALTWERLALTTGLPMFIFYYHFTSVYTRVTNRRLLSAGYLFLLLVCVLTYLGLVVRDMTLESYGYAPRFYPTIYLISLGGIFFLVMGLRSLIKAHGSATQYQEKTRLTYMSLAIVFPLLGGITDLFPEPPPVGLLGNILFCLVTAVAMLKYHLLDVHIVIRKGLSYLLASTFIAVPYVGFLLLVTQLLRTEIEPWWAHTVTILLLAIFLRPLYSWAQHLVDRLFYRDRYDYLRALENFSREAHSVTSLEDLGSTMVELISGALRLSSISLLLPSEAEHGWVVVRSTRLDSSPSRVVLKMTSPIVKWLRLHGDILYYKHFDIFPQLLSLSVKEKKDLEQLRANLYVPLKTLQGELSGILVLGEKLSQQSYSWEDKQLLVAVANQMAMALENARLYKESQQEVEERKRAEEALLKYKMAVDSSADLIAAMDQHYVYIFVNQTFLKYNCLKQDQVIGHTAAEILGEEVFRKTVKPNVDSCLQGQTAECEMELNYPGVGRRHLNVSYHPLKSSNKQTIGVVAVIRDITDSKQAEEREKKLQQELYLSSRLAAIGELAAGVAHEINNPLTGIVGFSQRLLRKSTDKEARQDFEIMLRDLGIIHNEAQRAAKVVQNLLTFARRREPKKQYSDINEILQSALELRAYELRTSNIEVVSDLALSLPNIMVDFHQIQEVFLNIILNAEQVMSEAHSGGKLTIKTEEKKGYIRTMFTDNGPGIPAEQLDKVFDPFFTTRGERGGTGLGLSACHGIVTEHGGRIYAKSKPGKGATFFVELPIIAEE